MTTMQPLILGTLNDRDIHASILSPSTLKTYKESDYNNFNED